MSDGACDLTHADKRVQWQLSFVCFCAGNGVGMPNIPAHVHWQKLSKHRVKAAVWDVSDARKSSKDGPAKYNPKTYNDPTIEALERHCIESGTVVDETADFVSCYVCVDLAEPFVGACSGDFTHYVWSEMYGGAFHGYPISEKLLRERLRKRGLPGP